jgi:hypothetical protein
MPEHRHALISDSHGPFAWHHADAAAREAQTVTADDVDAGLCSLQLDTRQIWRLASQSSGVGTWELLGGLATGAVTGLTALTDAPATAGQPVAVGANNPAFLAWREPVWAAATGNVNLASPGSTIDGVTLSAGQAFLAPAQTTGAQNGVYVWNGATAAATRRPDFDASGDFGQGAQIGVRAGDTHAGTIWRDATTGAFTLGTTTPSFEVVRASLSVTDGTTSGAVRRIVFPADSLVISGGVATYSAPGATPLQTTVDGTPFGDTETLVVNAGSGIDLTATESPAGTLTLQIAATGGGGAPLQTTVDGTSFGDTETLVVNAGSGIDLTATESPTGTLTLEIAVTGGSGSVPRAHYPFAQPSGALSGSTNFLGSIPTNWDNSFNPGGYTVTNAATDYGLLITHPNTGSVGTNMRLAGIYNTADFPAVGDSVMAFISIEALYTADQSGSTNSGYAFLAILENTSALATADVYGIGLRLDGNTMSGGYYAYASYNATSISNQLALGIGAQNSSGIWVAIHRELTSVYSFWMSGNGIAWRAFFRATLTFTGSNPAIALLLSNSASNSTTDKTQKMRCLSVQRLNSAPSPVGVIQ